MIRFFFTAVIALFLIPTEGAAQKWLKNLEKVAKEVDNFLGDTKTSSSDNYSTDTSGDKGQQAKGGTKIVTNHPDLSIKIKKCRASGNTCVIDMVVTNLGDKDLKNVIFYSGYNNFSIAFDDEGNQYGKYALLIGTNGNLSGRTLDNTDAWVLLPANVPIKMRMQIEGIPESATEFSRINLACQCAEFSLSHNKPIILSNIPISRDGDE